MPGKLILIVEDEPENAEIIRAVVEDILGHSALLTDNGQSAVEAALTERPNLVLMDLMIPVLNGYAAIGQLKASTTTQGIPVIALTALSRPKDHQMALDAGADDYISKPFDLDVLADKIERHLASAPSVTATEAEEASTLDEYDVT